MYNKPLNKNNIVLSRVSDGHNNYFYELLINNDLKLAIFNYTYIYINTDKLAYSYIIDSIGPITFEKTTAEHFKIISNKFEFYC